MKAALGVIGGLVLLFFGAMSSSSGTAYYTIPLASPETIALYIDAAAFIGDIRGVDIAWEDLLVFDTVDRDQDFSDVTDWTANMLAMQFTLYHYHEECLPPPNEDTCVFDEWYTLKSLHQVMNNAGFTTDQKQRALYMRSLDLEEILLN